MVGGQVAFFLGNLPPADRLDGFLGAGRRLVLDPSATTPLAAAAPERDERVALAIGPDRGFDPFERALLEARGFRPVRLGAPTLRVDTACVAAVGVVAALRDSGAGDG